MSESTPRVLIPLATGAEEMEVVILADVLRRGGCEVVLAGLDGEGPVRCSRGLRLLPDRALEAAVGEFGLLLLPGGAEGAERLAADPRVGRLCRDQWGAESWIGAICAAPIALCRHGIGRGRRMTAHPSVQEEVAAHGRWSEERVVVDGRLCTSRGPGTAFECALVLLEQLRGAAVAAEVAAPMLLPQG